jgi:hypothetical protein
MSTTNVLVTLLKTLNTEFCKSGCYSLVITSPYSTNKQSLSMLWNFSIHFWYKNAAHNWGKRGDVREKIYIFHMLCIYLLRQLSFLKHLHISEKVIIQLWWFNCSTSHMQLIAFVLHLLLFTYLYYIHHYNKILPLNRIKSQTNWKHQKVHINAITAKLCATGHARLFGQDLVTRESSESWVTLQLTVSQFILALSSRFQLLDNYTMPWVSSLIEWRVCLVTCHSLCLCQ